MISSDCYDVLLTTANKNEYNQSTPTTTGSDRCASFDIKREKKDKKLVEQAFNFFVFSEFLVDQDGHRSLSRFHGCYLKQVVCNDDDATYW